MKKFYHFLLAMTLCNSIYGMEQHNPSYNVYELFTQSPPDFTEGLIKHSDSNIIPFDKRLSVIVTRTQEPLLVPCTPQESYSTNHFKLPLIQLSEDKFMCRSSMAWWVDDNEQQHIEFQNHTCPLACPPIRLITFDGPNEHNLSIANIQCYGQDVIATMTLPEYLNIMSTNQEIISPPLVPLPLFDSTTPHFINAHALHARDNLCIMDYMHIDSLWRSLSLFDFTTDQPKIIAQNLKDKLSYVPLFKHLACLTAQTYIGTTETGTLYIIRRENNTLTLHKQKIPITLEDIAINQADHHKLVLLDKDKKLYYVNLHGLNAQKPIIYYKYLQTLHEHTQSIYYDNDYLCARMIQEAHEWIDIHTVRELSVCTNDTPEQDDPST